MSALHFIFSTMNAGKSTALLQANHSYVEKGMNTLLYTSEKDTRFGKSEIVSRIGLKANAKTFNEETNIMNEVSKHHEDLKLDCILIDEAQFLSKDQVSQGYGLWHSDRFSRRTISWQYVFVSMVRSSKGAQNSLPLWQESDYDCSC